MIDEKTGYFPERGDSSSLMMTLKESSHKGWCSVQRVTMCSFYRIEMYVLKR